ncbi:MAG: hypothetical protein GW834_11885, partial [Cyanobacteria bacterium]|nr:hypothetical protein [Cyanobacteria bacterium CG_2015-09_32_10]
LEIKKVIPYACPRYKPDPKGFRKDDNKSNYNKDDKKNNYNKDDKKNFKPTYIKQKNESNK